MVIASRILSFLFIISLCSLSILAQTERPIDAQPGQKPSQSQSTIIISAAASPHRVRFISLGEVNQTRVQIFAADGSVVFDSTYRLGNLVEWSLTTQQGQTLANGSYLFLVTVKDFQGNLTQKYGTAILEENQLSVQQTGREELSAGEATALTANQLAQTISPIDRIGAMGVNPAVTNSTDATTATTNTSQQQTKPATSMGTTGGTNLTTAGAIPKFSDNSGNLTNSIIAESNNQVFVAGNQLITPVGATPTYEVLAGSDPSSTVMLTTNSSNFGWQIAPTNGSNDTLVQVLGQTFASAPNRGEFGIYLGTDANSAFKVIQHGGSELFRVNRLGNVGISNPNPQFRLDVTGDINTSTQYNLGGNRVLAVTGFSSFANSNTFVSVGGGTANVPTDSGGIGNSFFGHHEIATTALRIQTRQCARN